LLGSALSLNMGLFGANHDLVGLQYGYWLEINKCMVLLDTLALYKNNSKCLPKILVWDKMQISVRHHKPKLVAPSSVTPSEIKYLSEIDNQGSARFQIP